MQKEIDKLLSVLNDEQKEAVTCGEGPVLVLAGAGSGKTRALTTRVAYLLTKKKVAPIKLLVLTFTNKAANEMKSRINKFLPENRLGLWMGTFHSIFARILRIDGPKIGLDKNYVIYDKSDQLNVVKNLLKEKGFNSNDIPPGQILQKINLLKNEMISPEAFQEHIQGPYDEIIYKVYKEYESNLIKNNALDFDDLLIKPIELFKKNPAVLQKYQKRFQYVLVDEFQDTNTVQYILLKLICENHNNLYVVGDDDQSIYGWRGARISNILDFQKDFPDTQIFKLEQNYRSTQNILNIAYSVIKNNSGRMPKKLWTDNNNGNKIKILEPESDIEEASIITSSIYDEISKNKFNWKDFAVLYRTNSQSRTLEKAFIDKQIPYNIVGGVKFYERKEIKDMLAYLNILVNNEDSIALERVINFPPRGIGKVTIEHLKKYSQNNNISLFDAVKLSDKIKSIGSKGNKNLRNFYKFIKKYIDLKKKLSLPELVSSLIDELKIKVIYKEEGTEQSLNRYENIQEFLNAIAEFSRRVEKPALESFLQEVSLYTDVDYWNEKSECVSLMTLHCSKGLEFPVVFITGVEEGLFPLTRDTTDFFSKDIEEERRLFYVGATRAKNELYISYAKTRFRYGDIFYCMPSRFISELDKNFIEHTNEFQITEKSRFKNNINTDIISQKEKTTPNYLKKERIVNMENSDKLHTGAQILHPKFGEGIILKREGKDDDLKITVEFTNGGVKKLLVKYAKLSIKN